MVIECHMQVRVWKEQEAGEHRGGWSADRTDEHIYKEAEMRDFSAPKREMLQFLGNSCSYSFGYILGNNVLNKY